MTATDYEKLLELHDLEVKRLGELAPVLVKVERDLETFERIPPAQRQHPITPERWKASATSQATKLRKEGEGLERSILARCEKYPELALPFNEQPEQLRITRARCIRYALELARMEALVKHQPESWATPSRAQRAKELRETVGYYREVVRRLEPWDDEAQP